MADHPWLIVYDETKGEDAYAMHCRRCGEKQRFALPIDLDIYRAALNVFGEQHARCKPRTEEKPET